MLTRILPALLLAAAAHAQDCFRWGEEFTLPDLDGDAHCTQWFDDGSGPGLFVGGMFSTAGGAPVNNVARFDGRTWDALGGGIGKGGLNRVDSLAVFDDGGGPAIYAGGTFPGQGPNSNVARWDGSAWSTVGPGMNSGVLALVAHDDGSGPALFACGYFEHTGDYSVAANRIARWDGQAWHSLGGGLDGEAWAMAVYDDGAGAALYVGGKFKNAGGSPAALIARWDGDNWFPVGAPFFVSGSTTRIGALRVFDPDGAGPAKPTLFAGGEFDRIGDVTGFLNIASWNGAAWSKVGNGFLEGKNGSPFVGTLTVFDDNTGPALYAGGNFRFSGPSEVNNIARWDGSAWKKLGKGVNGHVTALADLTPSPEEPTLGVFGSFVNAGGVHSPRMAKWTGLQWVGRGNAVSGSKIEDGFVAAFERYPSGSDDLYVGGFFQYAGGVKVKHLAALTPGGWAGVDSVGAVRALRAFDDGGGERLFVGGNGVTAWDGAGWKDLGAGFHGEVHGLTIFDADGGGPLVAVGKAMSAGGVDVNCVAALGGSGWTGFAPLYGMVHDAVIFDDGAGPALYVAGQVSLFVGEPATGVARWNGAQWVAVGSNLYGDYRCLAIFDDGSGPSLYVGGQFAFLDVNGVMARSVARWNGTHWVAVGAGLSDGKSPWALVMRLTSFDDGGGPALYAAGAINLANPFGPDEVEALGLARWAGAKWQPVGAGFLPPVVRDLEVFDAGGGPALYACGPFTVEVGGSALNRVARWTGTAWAPLGDGLAKEGGSADAFDLDVFDDGSGPALMVGGAFTSAGGAPALNIARWKQGAWTPLGAGVDHFDAMGVWSGDGALYVAGPTVADGTPVANFARWDGGGWLPAGGLKGEVAQVRTLAFDGEPRLFAVGNVLAAGVVRVDNVARWDGSAWAALGSGLDDSAFCAAVFDDGAGPSLYVGGWFTQAGGAPASCIARWDGSAWSDVGGGVSNSGLLSPAVHALAVFDDGSGPALYAGGLFDSAGGVGADAIARWDGASWAPVGSGFQPADGVFSAVYALAAFDDGSGPSLHAGGRFHVSGATPVSHVARWDGAAWQPMQSGADDEVLALHAHDAGVGSVLYAGGYFLKMGEFTAGHIARWGPCPQHPKPDCYPDCDGSKSLTVFDFLCFLNGFNAGAPHTDCTGDGNVDLFDFLCFVNAFNTGC